jgi:medium-chain acyl-[acyl-carrier-protein] hydrolase
MAAIPSYINTPWITCPRPNPRARLRLFCFPYSGAAASIFYPWVEGFLPEVEICPVQLPGRGTRIAETPYTRLEPLIKSAGDALIPYLDKPFAFFGHSLGALIGFELVRYLAVNYNLSPVHLFVSSNTAPNIPDPNPPIYHLPEKEFLVKIRELNGMSKEILENAELMQMLLPILKADLEVCDTYIFLPSEPLGTPISAFGGLKDIYVTREALLAWKELTSSSFSLRMFPGDHFYVNTDRPMLLQALARELTRYIGV